MEETWRWFGPNDIVTSNKSDKPVRPELSPRSITYPLAKPGPQPSLMHSRPFVDEEFFSANRNPNS